MGASANGGPIALIAAWCADEPERVEERVELVLEGLFADEWASVRRWPWGPVAKDPAKYAEAARVMRAKEAKARRQAEAEAAREREERERLRYELDAAPPSDAREARAALSAMIGGIGHQLNETRGRSPEARRRAIDDEERARLEARQIELEEQRRAIERQRAAEAG